MSYNLQEPLHTKLKLLLIFTALEKPKTYACHHKRDVCLMCEDSVKTWIDSNFYPELSSVKWVAVTAKIGQPYQVERFQTINETVDWLKSVQDITISPLNGECVGHKYISKQKLEIWHYHIGKPYRDYCFGVVHIL